MGKIIAIVNQKGGVGKTTSTINIGVGLGHMKKRVLLVDLDPSALLSQAWDNTPPQKYNIARMLSTAIHADFEEEKEEMRDLIIKSAVKVENVSLITANDLLETVTTSIRDIKNGEEILKKLLHVIKDDYDYIILDCAPLYTVLTQSALIAADNVIIPIQADSETTKGLQSLLMKIMSVQKECNPELNILGILFTMWEKGRKDARLWYDEVMSAYGEELNIFDTKITKSELQRQARSINKSIYAIRDRDLSDDCPYKFDYKKVADYCNEYDMLIKEVINNG